MSARPLVVIALVLAGIIAGVSVAHGQGVIAPDLADTLATADEKDLIPILIVFAERRVFTAQERAMLALLPKNERQSYVATEIVDFARDQHAAVVGLLEDAEANEEAGSIRQLEGAYAVSAVAVPAVIADIATQPEVSTITLDEFISAESILDASPADATFGESRSSRVCDPEPEVEWGVARVRAPDVWEAGYRGQRTLVAVLDNGFDYTHSDLSHHLWDGRGVDGAQLHYQGSPLIHHGWDVVNEDSDPIAYAVPAPSGSHHGTRSAGVVSGNGCQGVITGVAPSATLLLIKNACNLGLGECYCPDCDGPDQTESQLMAGFQFLLDLKNEYGDNFRMPDVTSMSASIKFPSRPSYEAWRNLMDTLYQLEILHFNSIGNEGEAIGGGCSSSLLSPIPYNIAAPGNAPPPWIDHTSQLPPLATGAAHASATNSVGSVGSNEVILATSSRGPAAWEDITATYACQAPIQADFWDYRYNQGTPNPLLKPDIVAPSGVRSTQVAGGYSNHGGTSAATPHAAGVGALLLSLNSALTPTDVSSALQLTAFRTSNPGTKDNVYGAGRVDAYEALLHVIAAHGATVLAGETLRLGAETLAMAPGVEIVVHGALETQGTVFTAADAQSGWGGIVAANGTVSLTGGRVEHATTGVRVYDPARVVIDGTALTDNGTALDVRSNSDGTQPGAVVEGAVIRDNTTGVRTDYVTCYGTTCTCLSGCRGHVALDGALVEENSGTGVYALNGTVNSFNSCVRGNTGHGITVANALVDPFTGNSLSANGAEETAVSGAAVLSGGDLRLSPVDAFGGNRLASNADAELYVAAGGAAFAGYESTSGRNAFVDAGGGTLAYAPSHTTINARYNWWGASPPPSGAFPGPGEVDRAGYLGSDTIDDACGQFPSGLVPFAADPPPEGVGGGEPGAVLEELRAEIRRLRDSLAAHPGAEGAAELVRHLYGLQRVDRADALGERAATMAVLAGLRVRLGEGSLPGGLRASAEAALEMEAADALAYERYAEARALIDAYTDRVSGLRVRRALTLTRAFLEAHAGRRAEAASLVAGVAAGLEDARERRELLALAAALGEGLPGASPGPGVAPVTASVQLEAGLSVAPNPSTGSAAIRLDLATAAIVRLVVYDVLGRDVAMLADGPFVEGAHALRFDGAGLPAGVYFVRAELEPDDGNPAFLVARLTLVR